MGKHKHHRREECFPCEEVRPSGPCRPCGPGGLFGGLFGGESNMIWIILIAVFFLCFCNKDGSGLGSLGDTPVRLLKSFMKSRGSAGPV